MKTRTNILLGGSAIAIAIASIMVACGSDPATSPTHLGVTGDGGGGGGDGGTQADTGGDGGSNFDVGGPIIVPNTKMVFVTSDVFLGDLGAGDAGGGLVAADQNCTTAAAAVGVPGAFKAWMSDGTTSAADRLSHATVPYYLANGMQIAKDWADLVANGPSMPITITEYGEAQPPSLQNDAGNFLDDAASGPCAAPVWTATDGTGQKVPATNCTNWTDPTPTSMGSGGGATTAGWTTGCAQTCDQGAALYCFQQ